MELESTPLCGFCSHLVTCPRFEGADTPELIPFVEELQGMQTQFKQLKSQIDNKKSELLEIVEQNGTLHVGSTILSKHIQNRSNMDTEKLYKFLESNGLNIAEFQKPSTATWLDIKKAK